MNKDGNVYRLKLIEAVSPLSKKPGTPFRLGALGIMQKESCYEVRETGSEPNESNPHNLPIVSSYNPPVCALYIEEGYAEMELGDKVEIEVQHGENEKYFAEYVTDDSRVFITNRGDNLVIEALEEVNDIIQITAIYSNCLECPFSVEVYAYIPEEPPVDQEARCTDGFKVDPLPIGVIVPIDASGGASGEVELEDIVMESGDTNLAELILSDGEYYIVTLAEGEVEIFITYIYSDGYECTSVVPVTITPEFMCGNTLGDELTYSPGVVMVAEKANMYGESELFISDTSVVTMVETDDAFEFHFKKKGIAYLKVITTYEDGRVCTTITKFIVLGDDDLSEPSDVPPPSGYEEGIEFEGETVPPSNPGGNQGGDTSNDVECPEQSDEPLAHFSGGLIGYIDSTKDTIGFIGSWFFEPFVDRGVDSILGEGCYPDAYAVLEAPIVGSLDSIMLKPNVRLEAWTETNFGGEKFLDVTGKYIDGGNAKGIANSSQGKNGVLDPMYEIYPQEEWVTTNLGHKEDDDPLSHDWKVASFRITKVGE